jgi:ubiquinone/menaquinone biosynthesis C-methylase UbiE
MTEKIKMIEAQTIDLRKISLNGKILDIGGGGEGVIGQLKGENVVVIDLKKSELEESMSAGDTKSLKIIMDAKELKFLDNSFGTVTAFFSMMYMKKEILETVLAEIYRVLDSEGELVIWDLIIPNRKKEDKEYIGIYLNVEIGEKTIETGYATKWDKEQDVNHYVTLATTTGFTLKEQNSDGNYFYIKCIKS